MARGGGRLRYPDPHGGPGNRRVPLAMETRIPEAAGLLPEIMGFDVIGYGCTSAATLIGEERVSAALHRAHPKVANTNPISAVLAAMEALGARRIAVITPYNAQVTTGIVSLLEERGLDVAAAGSFLEERTPPLLA
ncbi:MAG: hypothetical protein Ct9H300mP12_08810 [Acidimicrobiales bacterium]|nr:MAG: hypothetical protein Ct9H300mP12_08810 [Acidimicrobiales bacterium]